MTPHLIFVSAAWGATALGFTALILGALLRHRGASRRLRELERPR
ncbi:heme exporter protein CcmD [Roseomonas sp. CCTCC AB2023176]